MDIFRASFLSAVLVALVACGGTSSSSSSSSPSSSSSTSSSTSSSSSASSSSSSSGVTSSSSSSSSSGGALPQGCTATQCVFFEESIEEGYGNLTSFELTEENTFSYYYISPESSHVQWTLVDTEEPGFNKVVEVRFNGDDPFDLVNTNGWFGVTAADSIATVDLTEFAQGALTFDMRILRNGTVPNLLEFHMECHWPCHSAEAQVPDPPQLNKWQTYTFPMEQLIQSGLDITQVNHLMVFKPTWNLQFGQYIIQLDNIRLTKWHEVKIPVADFTADNLDSTHPELDLTIVDTIVLAPGWASSTELMGFRFQIDNARFEP